MEEKGLEEETIISHLLYGKQFAQSRGKNETSESMLLASGDLIFLEKQALGGPADEPEFKDVA